MVGHYGSSRPPPARFGARGARGAARGGGAPPRPPGGPAPQNVPGGRAVPVSPHTILPLRVGGEFSTSRGIRNSGRGGAPPGRPAGSRGPNALPGLPR